MFRIISNKKYKRMRDTINNQEVSLDSHRRKNRDYRAKIHELMKENQDLTGRFKDEENKSN